MYNNVNDASILVDLNLNEETLVFRCHDIFQEARAHTNPNNGGG